MSPKNAKNLIFDKIKNKRTKPDTFRGAREFFNDATSLVIVLSLYMFQFTMLFTM